MPSTTSTGKADKVFFMAKELPFFKFEISEWMFGRIQKQPLDTQGAFINLCCKYWHKLGEYRVEDAELDFGEEHLSLLLQHKIIGIDQGFIFIKFLDNQLDECQQNSEKQRIKGLKSAEVRANRKQQRSTTVQQRLSPVQPNSTEEKRKEEKREDEIKPRKFLDDFYQSKEQALEELKADDLYIDECHRLITGKGWRVATKVNLMQILVVFLLGKADLTNEKSDVKKHFKNWLIREKLDTLTKICNEG